MGLRCEFAILRLSAGEESEESRTTEAFWVAVVKLDALLISDFKLCSKTFDSHSPIISLP